MKYKIARTPTYNGLPAGKKYLHISDIRMPANLAHKHHFWIHQSDNATQFTFREACVIIGKLSKEMEQRKGKERDPELGALYNLIEAED